MRTTTGTLSRKSFAAATTPVASTSQRKMPPKMLMKTARTLGSLIKNAFRILMSDPSVRAAAHIQKICRRAARVLDDVHGGHGQAGAIDHAGHAAIELDVVQAVLGG